jgi:hypothetical protein
MTSLSARFLILIHIGISLGGVLIHLKAHPLEKSLYFWLASPVSAFSLLVIPFLYARPSTAAWGFMFNALTVLMGTIGMSYYYFLNHEGPFTLYRVITESTLPPIIILWMKVPVAYLILNKMKPQKVSRRVGGCAEWQEKP